MSTKGKFSPLMDPLLLESHLVNQKAGAIWDQLGTINWCNLFLNWIMPIGLFLFVAFALKDKYDRKRALYDEFGIY